MSRSQIDDLLWQGEEPERVCTPAPLGDFDMLILCHAGHQEPWERFENRGLRLARAPFVDDKKTLTYTGAVTATAASVHVATAVRGGYRVLVTCHRGLNRSGLVVALTLCNLHDISGRQAMDRVREKRPGALFNPAFAAFLESIS